MKFTIRKPYWLLVFALLFVCNVSISQVTSGFMGNRYYSNYSPKTPRNEPLGSFGSIPVNYYTGLPEVSLPLVQLSSRELNVPITLNYDATGVKVEDISGQVGLKWTLSAGGVIVRNLNSIPDEMPTHGYLATAMATNSFELSHPFDYIPWIEDGQENKKDTQPDEFYAYINGRTIKFVFDKFGNPHSIPHQKVIIRSTRTANKISRFEVQTEDGTKYTFGNDPNAIETRKVELLSVKTTFDNQYGQDCLTALVSYIPNTSTYKRTYATEEKLIDTYNSKWYLTRMEIPSGDFVLFNYSTKGTIKYAMRSNTGRIAPVLTNGRYSVFCGSSTSHYNTLAIAKFGSTMIGSSPYPNSNLYTSADLLGPGPFPIGALNGGNDATYPQPYFNVGSYRPNSGNGFVNQNLITEDEIRLNTITTAAGNSVSFTYSNLREDLPNATRLNTIVLYNSIFTPIKTIKLNYAFVQATQGTDDFFSLSEAIMMSKISGLSTSTNFYAYMAADYSESQVTDALLKKYTFEGLKVYNYKRMFLESIEESNPSLGGNVLSYQFGYKDRTSFQRRTSPMVDLYGFARSEFDAEKPLDIGNGKKAHMINAYDPASKLSSTIIGRHPDRGMLNSIKYASGGSTNFDYIIKRNAKVSFVKERNSIGALIKTKTIQYDKVVVNNNPVFVSYLEMKINPDWFKVQVTTSYPQSKYNLSYGVAESNYEVSVLDGINSEKFIFTSSADDLNKDVSSDLININTGGGSSGNTTVYGTIAGGSSDIFPFARKKNNDHLRGLLKEHIIYGSNGPRKKVVNHYTINPNGFVPIVLQGIDVGQYSYERTFSLHWFFGCDPCNESKKSYLRYGKYNFTNDWVVLSKTIETNYSQENQNQLTEKVTDVIYSSIDLLPVESISYLSNDPTTKLINRTKYPKNSDYDFFPQAAVDCQQQYSDCLANCASEPDSQVQAYCYNSCQETFNSCYDTPGTSASIETNGIVLLRRQNQISSPIEIQKLVEVDGTVKFVDNTVFKYQQFGVTPNFFVKPKEVWSMNQPVDVASYQSSKVNTDGTFYLDNSKLRKVHSYDSYNNTGNLLQQTSLDGTVSTYAWDATNSLVNSFTVNPGGQQHQTFYTHKQLVGVTQSTDPNSIKTDYEFDGLNRLIMIKDNDGNIFSRYRYHYKTQNESLGSTLTASNPRVVGTPVNFSAPDPIPFQASTSITYKWDFGDQTGTTTTGYGASHVYNTPGQYTITVNKSHPEVNPITATTTITVTPQLVLATCGDGPVRIDLCQQISPQPGTCTTGSITINSPTTIKATVSGGCGTYTYAWDFQFNSGPWQGFGSGSTVAAPAGFTNRTIGNYNVRCTVTDGCGNARNITLPLAIFKTNPNC